MHRDREIRLLYPPVFLAAALLWAWHASQVQAAAFHVHRWKDTFRTLQDSLLPGETAEMLAWLAASGVVLLAAGFLIGALSQALLRLLGTLWGRAVGGRPWAFEAVMADDMRRRVWRDHFGASGRPIRDHGPAVVAAFDHARLEPGIQVWIERRWNAFHSNTNSALALGLAMVFVAFGSLAPGAAWWAGTGLVALAFGSVAASAYGDVRRMNDLLADTLPDWARARRPRGRLRALGAVHGRLKRVASWNPRH